MANTVLITGSSRGIGSLTAQLFAQRGWNVVATARKPEQVRDERFTVLPLDVDDEAGIKSAVDATLQKFGAIDVLVNNAGYGLFGPLEGATAQQWEDQFRTNVMGMVNTIRHVLPAMREKKSGAIVNVSSIAGRVATPFMSAYHASKYAIEGLSESLQYELAVHGIRVKLVEPAHFKTDFLSSSLQRTAHDAYQKQFTNYMKWVEREDATAPEPSPVAEAIYRAATDKSARLRYTVGGGLLLAMIKLLPAGMFRELNMQGLTRVPK